MLTELKYPKNMFKYNQILREKTNFDYPKAWEIKEDSKNYYLKLNSRLYEMFYINKKIGGK